MPFSVVESGTGFLVTNCSMKLKACEIAFVTKSYGKWVVYPVKLVSHENLLGLVWKKSGVGGSSWNGIGEQGNEARFSLEDRLWECTPLKKRSLSQYESEVSSEVQRW